MESCFEELENNVTHGCSQLLNNDDVTISVIFSYMAQNKHIPGHHMAQNKMP